MPYVETIVSLLFQNLVSASSNAVIGHHHSPHHSLITVKAALLKFKKTIVYDPYSMLATWKEATDVCNFIGVSCNTQHHRVTDLILQDYALAGRLSPIAPPSPTARGEQLSWFSTRFLGTSFRAH
ncbi:hypothetical protein C1H46_024675 [Malus baccata]|uniref:Leucine-rich repeat-containing N-terminal plant-type domain-containing protein n=1 Tax=Malus baccata TaxID=106549 RepID=A0A540LTD7_MALBA|nr:hypothetical protein C1H46_024675 [Malus baccata]